MRKNFLIILGLCLFFFLAACNDCYRDLSRLPYGGEPRGSVFDVCGPSPSGEIRSFEYTPLMAVVRDGTSEDVRAILSGLTSEDVNRRHDYGWSAMDVALAREERPDRLDIIKMLIEHGANVNARSTITDSWSVLGRALMLADRSEVLDVLKVLMDSGADFNLPVCNYTGLWEYALDLVLRAKNTSQTLELLQALIAGGATVKKWSLWTFASTRGKYSYDEALAITDLLIGAGADINYKGGYLTTPLIIAAKYPHGSNLIRAFLARGADVNVQTEKGRDSALTSALSTPHLENFVILLQASADIEHPSALQSAIYGLRETYEDHRLEKYLDIINKLLDAGASLSWLDEQDKHGKTPLMYACEAARKGGPTATALLLDWGANPHMKDKEGKTALDYARKNWRLQGTDILRRLEKVVGAENKSNGL